MESTVDRAAVDAAHAELHPNGAGSRGEIEGEAGVAVGDMPPEAPRDEQPPVEELRVDGTAQLSAFDLGGKRATSASIRLTGGRVQLVDGRAFHKGETVSGTFTAIVREVAQRDKPDKQTGIVVSAEQKHIAEIVDLTIET